MLPPSLRIVRPVSKPLARWLLLCCSLSWAVVATAPALAAEPMGQGPAELLDRYRDALVTVQGIAQVEATGGFGALLGGEEELVTEATCTIIDRRGIVLCSNTRLEGYARLMQYFLGPAGRGMSLSVRPVGLGVLTGSGERLEARLLATDSELDLAWLEIITSDGRSFPAVDLADAVAPRVGDRLLLLQRLEEHFGRAAVCVEGRIGGMTELPRLLYVPTIRLEAAYGLPVFSSDGRWIGVTVAQLPELETLHEAGGTLGQMQNTTRLRSLATTMILPAGTVAKASARVLATRDEPPPLAEP